MTISFAKGVAKYGIVCYNGNCEISEEEQLAMKKKLLSLCLAVALLVGTIAVIPMTTRATSDMKASEECIAIIKEFEGFVGTPYVDSDGLYTIGYGTRCPTDMVEYYKENPMTEEEADAALREKMSEYESAVNAFIDKHSLTYAQCQFDAVVSLVFNIGPNWLNKGSTLIAALSGGAEGNDLIQAFTIYSMSGGKRSEGHIRRRLAEANMYLNGVYNRTAPSNYGYVLYKAGAGKISGYDVQGYDVNLTATPLPTATYEGYVFQGWYTAANGGELVTVLDENTRNTTLYAHYELDPNYVSPDTTEPAEPTVPETTVPETAVPETTAPTEPEVVIPDGTPIEKVQVEVTGSVVNIRKGPGLSYTVIGSVVKGDKVTVSATYENDDHLWGKFDLGWVCLDNTNYAAVTQKPEDKPSTGNTTGGSTSSGNSGSSTGGNVSSGNTGTSSGGTSSGNSGSSSGTTKPSTSTTTTVTKTYATIINTNTQNVRQTPDGTIVGVLYRGDKVEILEQKTVNGRLWGRCSKGWICMRTYVKLETVKETVTTNSNASSGSTSSGTSGNTSTGTTTPSTGTATTVTKTYATVIKTSTLNIRKTPDGTIVGKLYLGDKVEILETKTVNGRQWGRCSQGWICLRSYAKLETVTETTGSTASGNTSGTQKPADTTVTVTKTYATIINTNSQNVRTSPDGTICGTLKKGDKVEILEQKTVNGRLWGRCSKGWICMRTYVKLETVTEKVSASSVETGKVTATCLNIRSGAGTNYSIVGQLYKDTTVVILEKKTVNGTTWARIDKGWISMTYVK